jgi:hypothetical protein
MCIVHHRVKLRALTQRPREYTAMLPNLLAIQQAKWQDQPAPEAVAGTRQARQIQGPALEPEVPQARPQESGEGEKVRLSAGS